MLLFCRRMCHQLLLASNCFLSTSFLQTGLSISPRCYCDLLVNCTNHFFLKSVLCSCTKMSHGQRLYISVRLHKGRLVLLYPPHPTPSLIFSNYFLNLLELVSLKRDCKGDRLLFVCLLFHHQSSIIVITQIEAGTGTLSSILVELHKMIGMLHAPDSYFFSQHALLI